MLAYCPNCDREVETTSGACPTCQSTLVRTRQADLLGQVIDGRYEVLGRLGRGGMGEVYLVRQRIIDRVVALKVLRNDLVGQQELVQRFLREARAMGRLTCANTIRLFDFGVTGDGTPYFTMEYLEGEPLAERMKRERRLEVGLALDVSLQVCESLHEAHGKGILHRDLKPENIYLVATEGSGWQVRVLDFGIAKILDDEGPVTRAGQLVGTPRYVAPEALRGEPVDARADIYALALMLYEMLTGEAAFEGTTALEVLAAKLNRTPTHLRVARPEDDCPAELCDLVMRAAAPDPSERPSSVAEFAEGLRVIRSGLGQAPVDGSLEPNADDGGTRLRLETLVSPEVAARLPEPLPAEAPATDAGDSLLDLVRPRRPRRARALLVAAALAAGLGLGLWAWLREAPPRVAPVSPTEAPATPTVAPRPLAPAPVAPTVEGAPVVPPPTPPEADVEPAVLPVDLPAKGAPTPTKSTNATAAPRPKAEVTKPGPAEAMGRPAGLFELKAVDTTKKTNPFEMKPVGRDDAPSP